MRSRASLACSWTHHCDTSHRESSEKARIEGERDAMASFLDKVARIRTDLLGVASDMPAAQHQVGHQRADEGDGELVACALGAEHGAKRGTCLAVGRRRHAPRQQQDEAMRDRWRSVQSEASAATDAPPKSRNATDETPLLHHTLTNRYSKQEA